MKTSPAHAEDNNQRSPSPTADKRYSGRHKRSGAGDVLDRVFKAWVDDEDCRMCGAPECRCDGRDEPAALTGRAPLDPGAVATLDRMADAVAGMVPEDAEPELWTRGESFATVEVSHGLSHAAERVTPSAALDLRPLANMPLGTLPRLGADNDTSRAHDRHGSSYEERHPDGAGPVDREAFANLGIALAWRRDVAADLVPTIIESVRLYVGDYGDGCDNDRGGGGPAVSVDCAGACA